MPEAVEILALELGVRFLSDWLRGDSYSGSRRPTRRI